MSTGRAEQGQRGGQAERGRRREAGGPRDRRADRKIGPAQSRAAPFESQGDTANHVDPAGGRLRTGVVQVELDRFAVDQRAQAHDAVAAFGCREHRHTIDGDWQHEAFAVVDLVANEIEPSGRTVEPRRVFRQSRQRIAHTIELDHPAAK